MNKKKDNNKKEYQTHTTRETAEYTLAGLHRIYESKLEQHTCYYQSSMIPNLTPN